MATSVFLGAGAGSSLIHQATLTLNNADFKALPGLLANWPTIVVAPGANKMLLPVATFFKLDAAAGAYADDDSDGYITVVWGEWERETGFYFPANQSSNQRITVGGGIGAAQQIPTTWTQPTVAMLDSSTVMVNNKLALAASNGGNFTAGDDSNSFSVSLLYTVVDITTGVFE